MSLIECPECGNQVSSQAAACPQCGCPRSTPPEARHSQQQSGGGMGGKIAIIIAVVAGLVLLIPCVGILAALAIPAFVTYLNRAKTAEAEAVVAVAADEAQMMMEDTCQLPPALPSTADPADCCGGGECEQNPDRLEQWHEAGFSLDLETSYFVYEAERVDENTYVVRAIADFSCNEPNHTVEVTLEREITGGEPSTSGVTRGAEGADSDLECEVWQSPAVVIDEFM